MALPNVYDSGIAEQLISRINLLTPTSQSQWGKMNVSQMLAHSNVTYEYVFDERNDKPNFIVKAVLKNFVKPKVVGESAYPQNSPTGPAFIMNGTKDFEKEKQRLIDYIRRVVEAGREAFEGKESSSFGILTAQEWNNMMYKHLDHHLSQFGV